MGWLQLARNAQAAIASNSASSTKDNADQVLRVEKVANQADIEGIAIKLSFKQYPFMQRSISNDALPFIPGHEVLARRPVRSSDTGKQGAADVGKGIGSECWVVIDNIVYDCTEFISQHPGGEQVILSFIGEDCSWQFWRFHGKNEMEQYGIDLRVGRTEGIRNRFVEPMRYVGLSKLGDDDW